MIDIEQYIPEQKEKLLEFLLNAPKMRCQPKMEVEQFVRRSLLLHRNLIERWGGLSYRSSSAVCEYEPAESRTVIRDLHHKMLTEVQNNGERITQNAFEAWWHPLISGDGGGIYGSENIFLYKTLPQTIGFRDLGEGQYDMTRYGPKYTLSLGAVTRPPKHPRDPGETVRFEAPIRIGQRISSVAEEIITEKIEPILPLYAKALRRFLQAVGEQIHSTQRNETSITLSVRPVDFVRIGHYGERSSCYQNSGAWDSAKMYLAADLPDSFVGHIHRHSKKSKDSGEIRGRFWGVAARDRGALCSNFYMLSHVSARPAVLKALSEGLGIKKPKLRWSGEDPNSKGNQEGRELLQKGLMLTTGEANSLYMNLDWAIYTGSSGFRHHYSMRYMKDVWAHVAKVGAYTRNGMGPVVEVAFEMRPQELRAALQHVIVMNGNPVPVDGPARPRPVAVQTQYKEKAPKKLWPYPDFDFVEERKKITEVKYV